jgi:hypothetical protein
MKPAMALGLYAAVLAGLPACSTQEAYNISQGWQQEQCVKLPPGDERFRCQNSKAMSYDKYKAESEAARKPTP